MHLIDTHVLIWLYIDALNNLPEAVLRRLDQVHIGVSPFVLLELDYLYEIGRTRGPSNVVMDELSTRLDIGVSEISSAAVCRAAQGLRWTRDPFDRLLAAHSTASGLTFVTKDETIRRNLPLAWWGE